MKNLIISLIFALIFGCSTYQNNTTFSGSRYISKDNIRGKPAIEFSDSTFKYTKGIYDGYGKWKISSNGKFLILEGNFFLELPNKDSIFIEKLNIKIQTKDKDLHWIETINKKFKIKNDETLIDSDFDYVYIKEK
jgi:hypothetical protein